MSQIKSILQKLEGTAVYNTLIAIEKAYNNISVKQQEWYDKTNFKCPPGCGHCCENFEPDILESEALYMAAWLLENKPCIAMETAQHNFPYKHDDKTCPFYNAVSPYHCSIYGGRPFICRLFGASGSYSKNHEIFWRPCKFYPEKELKAYNPLLEKKQYTEKETLQLTGAVPPAMSDLMEEGLSFSTDSDETVFLHKILPRTIQKLLWLIDMNGNDNDTPNGSPNGAPQAA
jgi:Fe-S-cluster containining protein